MHGALDLGVDDDLRDVDDGLEARGVGVVGGFVGGEDARGVDYCDEALGAEHEGVAVRWRWEVVVWMEDGGVEVGEPQG